MGLGLAGCHFTTQLARKLGEMCYLARQHIKRGRRIMSAARGKILWKNNNNCNISNTGQLHWQPWKPDYQAHNGIQLGSWPMFYSKVLISYHIISYIECYFQICSENRRRRFCRDFSSLQLCQCRLWILAWSKSSKMTSHHHRLAWGCVYV